ncbi:copper transporter [Natronoglycomyces albus]|uniref:Copper transporter n=1 Tax=Natronoglycomyces albus TaxID=2811108 RepID=A0A895XKH2_9ACTN|nr:copper transporter [Natronoglycomyces albus]QSB03919.1 copper transporter [Natronoglycomyces albus]
MINFRYHLLSLTAVFLALTVGLILGTAALNGPAVEILSDRVSNLTSANDSLRAEINELQDELADDQEFASIAAPYVLEGTLAAEETMIVALPGVDSDTVDQVEAMLGYTEASVAGRMMILDDFFDPTNNDSLADLADRTAPEGFEVPVTFDGVEAISSVLAAVTMAEGSDEEVSNSDRTAVLSGLTEMGMLTIDADPTGEATSVIVLTGGTATDSGAEARNDGVVTFADTFASTAHTVLGGTTSAGDGNPLATVRNDEDTALSTVDNVSSTQGEVAVVAALAALAADGTISHLGTGSEAEGLLPAAS